MLLNFSGDFVTRHAVAYSAFGLLLAAALLAFASGCGSGDNTIVEENAEYSYEDVAAQIAAEEATINEEE